MNKFFIDSLKIFGLIFIISCESIKPVQNVAVKQNTDNQAQNKIISVIIDVAKPSPSSPETTSLYELTIINGYLKTDIAPAPTPVADKWMVSFLDANRQLVKNTVIDDPLVKDYEYVEGEVGSMKMAHKTVRTNKGSFSIRARYKPEMRYVLLEKADASGKPSTSKEFEITQ